MADRSQKAPPTATRRTFLKQAAGLAASLSVLPFWLSWPASRAWGATRKLLPGGTDLKTLVNENPANLGTRNLDILPLEKFGTMGLADHPVELKDWRLTCSGQVSREVALTYEQVLALPPVERPVLLICPGFFANHGRWMGVSAAELAKRVGIKKGVTHVTVSGPSGPYAKTFRFTWEDAVSRKVFLAYRVNGEALPVKHGFPLRLVAEGYYGYEWVKYVDRVRFDQIDQA